MDVKKPVHLRASIARRCLQTHELPRFHEQLLVVLGNMLRDPGTEKVVQRACAVLRRVGGFRIAHLSEKYFKLPMRPLMRCVEGDAGGSKRLLFTSKVNASEDRKPINQAI